MTKFLGHRDVPYVFEFAVVQELVVLESLENFKLNDCVRSFAWSCEEVAGNAIISGNGSCILALGDIYSNAVIGG